ncbi:hypothetical protein F4810DRAFT_397253 [Camillea tinctor]|nr:hypothetical protein F4810DRAFT_397253 [Camillea tinctor]
MEARSIHGQALHECLIHEVIAKHFQARPDAEAVCSADGQSLSYAQLDHASAKLAHLLNSQGVEPEIIVPLCFDKSIWTVVAILAVLRAGGAFVLLDPAHPDDRLRRIILNSNAGLVIVSSHFRLRFEGLVARVFSLSSDFISQLPHHDGPPLKPVMPHNLAYIVYTSGSTGTPKASCIEHGSFCAGALGHVSMMHINSTSRFVQFASYNFDASIVEMLSTLVVGGTICIVDDIARLDSVAFGVAIKNMRASVALLTASFINALDEQALEGLTTLIQGGEALPRSIVEKWAPKLQLMNAYGQVEASVVSTCTTTLSLESDCRDIGKPVIGRCWVIDPDDPSILLSPGKIGELLVEGPHVGRGYLGQPEKTVASFIRRPIWHEDLFPEEQDPRALRFYRTGDLVIQEKDGNFTFHGRKDEQVKLNGQRIELGEIEHQFKCALQPPRDIAVELVKTRTGNKVLIAFVSMGTAYTGDEETAQKLLDCEIATSEKKVRQALPYFMIPASYFAVECIPMSLNGKVDRKKLRAWGEARLQKVKSRLGVSSEDSGWNDAEKTLRKIWSRVLNVSEEDVSKACVFQSLGGDSITAMQVVSQASSNGLWMTVQDIMQKKTIARIALEAAKNVGYNSGQSIQGDLDEVEVNMPFKLAPVQKLFFQLSPNGENHDNISFLFRLKRPVSQGMLNEALEAVVRRHPMLKARFFEMKRGHWLQYISDDIQGSFHGSSHVVDNMSQLKLEIAKLQRTLDIRDGPLLRGDLISIAESSEMFLFLCAHHLVTDFFSLRVVLHCLEQHLQAPSTYPPETISFQKWCYEQEMFFRTPPAKNLTCVVPEPDLEFWGMKDRQNLYGDSITESLLLDFELSATLLARATNTPLGTEFVDALLSGVIHAFKQIFFDRHLPVFYVEGHGREPFWDNSIDLSLTVGWFTTIAPIILGDDQANDPAMAMRAVKDSRTALVGRGLGHFASQHYQKGHRTEPPSSMEIIFNYAGIFQQFEKEDALLQQVPGFNIMNMDAFGENLPRWGLVEILGNVVNGCIQLSFTFNKNMRHQDRIRLWMQECRHSFNAMATQLTQTCLGFPLLGASAEQMSNLEVNVLPSLRIDLEEVEDIYPCSPMQHGMLLSQIGGRATYTSELFFEITSKAEEININHLERVWTSLINRHAAFRTVFVESVRRDGSFDQIVLRKIQPSVSRLLKNIEEQPTWKWVAGQPEHHLWICQISPRRIDLRLDISHVLIDGSSISTLKHDLQRGYDNIEVLDSMPRPLYSEYIKRLAGLSHEISVDYWKQYLSNIEPCQFPQSSNSQESRLMFADIPCINYEKMLGFCRSHGITLSDLLKTTWAFVLNCYTGCENPVFGYLSSNRTEDDDGAIGVYTNIQLCAVKMTPTTTVSDIITKVQSDGIDQMKHRECPLVDVMHAMDNVSREGLCNTAMSLQKMPAVDKNSSISISIGREKDLSEFDLTFIGHVSDKSIKLSVEYWTSKLSTDQAQRVAATVSKLIDSILGNPNLSICELDILSSQDLNSLLQWSERLPADFVVNECIHEIIEKVAQEHPEHIAVRAWDGMVTYGQLNHLSTKLACHLREDRGSGPEKIVPVYMEKSVWAIVAMLAVLKAGAAFTPLSPDAPLDHILTLLDKISANYVITSPRLFGKLKNYTTQIIVSREFMNNLTVSNDQRNTATPANLAYVLFTSGSTGHPKGVMVQHSQFLSSSISYSPILGLDSTSRVLQFSAYTFDMSILEIWSTLTSGGCVCQMSEEQRKNDIVGAIKSFGVNTLTLTPTVLGLIDPQDVPNMRTVAIGGEVIPESVVLTWAPVTNLIEIYGPTETAVLATARTGLKVDSDRLCIGESFCCNAFVVDTGTERLVPVGAVGELWLEGPSVTRGYLNDEAQTAKAFVWRQNWLKPNVKSRFYRTGDLVRNNEDGSLNFYDRKDRQVKIRGQRFELSELEHQAASLLGIKATSVAAEMVNSKLVLLIEAQDATPEQVQVSLAMLEKQLPKKLSVAMNSPILIPVSNRFPHTSSGKLDRKWLRAKATEFVGVDGSWPVNQHTSNTWISKTQERLHFLLARVLGIQSSQIQPHDNFFHLGGDSYLAMQLVVAARDEGFQLSVASILRNPILADLVETMECNIKHNDEIEISPFALVANLDVNKLKKEAIVACFLPSVDDIEDIYPVTPMQEALIVESLKSPTAYIGQHIIEFPASPTTWEPDRIRDVWKSCMEENPILRTRVFQTLTTHPPRTLQVVLRESKVELGFANGLDDYLRISNETWTVGYGRSLSHVTIVIDHGKTYLVWTVHHCLYDAISLKLLLERLNNISISSKQTARVPFYKYVEYTEMLKESDIPTQFWRTYLANYTKTTFPRIQRNSIGSQKVCEEFRLDKNLKGNSSNITPATTLYVAWGLLISAYNGLATDVVFGSVMSGRSSPLKGVEDIIGPTIVALPLRVKFERTTRIQDLLTRVQEQSVAMIPHQALGLQNIQSINSDTLRACSFSTLFVVQQTQPADLPLKSTSQATNISSSYYYAINTVCSLLSDRAVAMSVVYDTVVLDSSEIHQMMQQFDKILGQISDSRNGSRTVEDLIKPIVKLAPEQPIDGPLLGDIAPKKSSTEMQRHLKMLWAECLGIHQSSEVDIDDNFLKLGGNSITAMQLSGIARREGFSLQVVDILQRPIFCEMASYMTIMDPQTGNAEVPVFSLLADGPSLNHYLEMAASDARIQIDDIEDMYPCTPLQEGLMASSSKRAGSYVMQLVFDLQPRDLGKFKIAWETIVRHYDILRTRIVDLGEAGLCQMVLKPSKMAVVWRSSIDLDEYVTKDLQSPMGLGDPLVRYAIITAAEGIRFVWTAHHAVYDRTTVAIISTALNRALSGALIQQPPRFTRLIEYLKTRDTVGSNKFWELYLAGVKPVPFPLPQNLDDKPRADQVISRTILFDKKPSRFTISTILQASWALVLAHHSNCNDVVFGLTQSGRLIPVREVDKIPGPMVVTVPVRIKLDNQKTLLALLEDVQSSNTASIPFYHHGLQNISCISDSAKQACDFRTLLSIYPKQYNSETEFDLLEGQIPSNSTASFHSFPLLIDCEFSPSSICLICTYDLQFIGTHQVQYILQQWDSVIQQLITIENGAQLAVSDISLLGSKDFSLLERWATSPPTLQRFKNASSVWIIDSQDRNQLAPIGAVGEVVLGQKKDILATAESPAKQLAWCQNIDKAPLRLFYTGKLARFVSHGSLEVVGEVNDILAPQWGQYIVYGAQRLIRQALRERGAAAQAIKLVNHPTDETLVGIVEVEHGHREDEGYQKLLEAAFAAIGDSLHSALPSFIVPRKLILRSLFSQEPLTNNILRQQGYSSVSLSSGTPMVKPSDRGIISPVGNRMEELSQTIQVLLSLCQNILGLKTVDAQKSFISLGGDSLYAMKLVTAARRRGISITVKSIFDSPNIADLAKVAILSGFDQPSTESIGPFSTLGENAHDIINEAACACDVGPGIIEDIYPCTAMQEGLMALSSIEQGAYIAEYIIRVPSNKNSQSAWQQLVALTPILRTRIVQINRCGSFQVVLREGANITVGKGLDEFFFIARREKMSHGKKLVHAGFIHEGSNSYLAILIHHAIFDGWAWNIIMRNLQQLYMGEILAPSPQYCSFVNYTLHNLPVESTESFWRSYLDKAENISFPPMSTHSLLQPQLDTHKSRRFDSIGGDSSGYTITSMIQTAWALLIGRYSSSKDVTIGVTLSGRTVPVHGIEDMIGPTLTTIPMRFRIGGAKRVVELLQNAQDMNVHPAQHFGLQRIRQLGPGAQAACNFANLLVVQPANEDETGEANMFQLMGDSKLGSAYTGYSIALLCQLLPGGGVSGSIFFDSRMLEKGQATRLLGQMNCLLKQISSQPNLEISQLEYVSIEDKTEISISMRSDLRLNPVSCLHEIMEFHAQNQPSALAVSSWDGNFTYQVLDRLASQLAHHLTESLYVEKGDAVPLCFHKSKWTQVAMLGVLKAGACFVLLDPAYPIDRLQSICRKVNASVALVSTGLDRRLSEVVRTSFVLDHGFKTTVPLIRRPILSDPNQPAYITTTSGTTGTPKACVISHSSIVRSALSLSEVAEISSATRAMQFASYSFDVCIIETLMIWVAGGCTCVLSETERKDDIAGALTRLSCNWAAMTPSLARLLSPELIPKMKTFLIGGEAITTDILETWAGNVNLFQGYGPCECTPVAFVSTTPMDIETDPHDIGIPLPGVISWVVDPDNRGALAPLGAVGELVIEGPTVGNGYIDDIERTNDTFITDAPVWRHEFPGVCQRMYMTGDLVRWSNQGTLLFVGRKDTQVKLHGQRLELADIEHHLKAAMAKPCDLAVELITSKNNIGTPVIAAFITVGDSTDVGGGNTKGQPLALSEEINKKLAEALGNAKQQLAHTLPSYMIPRIFIPVQSLPLSIAGKVDRKLLRSIGAAAKASYLESTKRSNTYLPETDIEHTLKDLWMKILNVTSDMVHPEADFFSLKGDSLLAMRLAAQARESGVELQTAEIVRNPTFMGMVSKCKPLNKIRTISECKPFLSLPDDVNVDLLLQNTIGVPRSDVEDIIEATSLQRMMTAVSLFPSQETVNHLWLDFEIPVDVCRLRQACVTIVNHHPILRTVFVPYEERLLQVIYRTRVPDFSEIYEAGNISDATTSIIENSKLQPKAIGENGVRFNVIRGYNSRAKKSVRLIMRIPHSLYDGISLPIILDHLRLAYSGLELPTSPSFSAYLAALRHLQTNSPTAEAFWKQTLLGSSITPVSVSSKATLPHATRLHGYLLEYIRIPEAKFRFETILHTAWALVLASFTRQKDVVFGRIVANRSVPIPNASSIVGPCFNMIPMRISTAYDQTCERLLRKVEQQQRESISHEYLELEHIVQHCTNWPRDIRFGSVVVYNDFEAAKAFEEGEISMSNEARCKIGFATMPPDIADILVTAVPDLQEGRVRIDIAFSEEDAEPELVKKMLQSLCRIVGQLYITGVQADCVGMLLDTL